MNLSEYADHDACGLAELVKQGSVSPEELYALAFEAIELVNPDLNAVADGPWERPHSYDPNGAFRGVPFAIKDQAPNPGRVPVRSGTRLSGPGIVSPDDSYLTQRYQRAGLAGIALTTTPEFGMNVTSEALVYGPTANPWDTARSAGGSSGGSAALVAAGAVPLAHSGDGGGSTRIPAAHTGLIGMKTSRGRTSDGPDFQEILYGLATHMGLARTMRDCAAALDAVSGPMPGDKFIIRDPARPYVEELTADVGRLRIAVHASSWSSTPTAPEVNEAVDAVAQQLSDLGHEVDLATPQFEWGELLEVMDATLSVTCAAAIEQISAASGLKPGPDTLEATTMALWSFGKSVTALEMAEIMGTANKLTRIVGEFFTQWDLLVTPTVPTPPPALGSSDANNPSWDHFGWIRSLFEACSFTPLFNVSGTPAVSLPLGWTNSGLPIGIQVAAPMCEEGRLITVGRQLEDAMPWKHRRPKVHAAYMARSVSTPS